MVNICELVIKIVSANKRKLLIRLSQNGDEDLAGSTKYAYVVIVSSGR
ncbi:MAG: hypothetical protein KBD25_00925 [Rickettsiaceae bacterium]|nr:hypothetical protein [Rickettsiaceae bacterium]